MPGMRFDRKHRVIAVAAALQTCGFDVRGVRDGRECRVVDARAQRTSGLQHHALNALWPIEISSDRVFKVVRAPRQGLHHGAYAQFIGSRLPREIAAVGESSQSFPRTTPQFTPYGR